MTAHWNGHAESIPGIWSQAHLPARQTWTSEWFVWAGESTGLFQAVIHHTHRGCAPKDGIAHSSISWNSRADGSHSGFTFLSLLEVKFAIHTFKHPPAAADQHLPRALQPTLGGESEVKQSQEVHWCDESLWLSHHALSHHQMELHPSKQ